MRMRIVAAVAATVSIVIFDLQPARALDTAESVCASAKVKATAKKMMARMKCETKAIAKNLDVDTECLAKVETKFNAKFAAAELKGGCVSDGDAAFVESALDSLVDDTVALQKSPPQTVPCTTENVMQPCGSCTGRYCICPTASCIPEMTYGDVMCSTARQVPCTSNADCLAGEYCFSMGLPPFFLISVCALPCP